MEDKYYTPSIEEFHVGFEYEYLHYNYTTGEDEWIKHSLDLQTIYESDQAEHPFPNDTFYSTEPLTHLRVKYLDRRNIQEVLGWVDLGGIELQGYSGLGEGVNVWLYKGFTISWDNANSSHIEISKDGMFCYRGSCKNKSKLITILKDLGL